MTELALMTELEKLTTCTFAGLDTTTIPTLKGGKSNPMQGRVLKIVTGSNVMVFPNRKTNGYENKVKRQMIAEGYDAEGWTLSPRRWGERMADVPVVTHKGNRYLEVQFIKAGTVAYTLDGQPIDKADIIGLNEKPQEAHQGGIENKVILRDYNFTSLNTVRISGKTLHIN